MIKIFSIPIQEATKKGILNLVSNTIKSREQTSIATVNNEILLASRVNKAFRDVLKKSFCIADSAGVVWAANFLYGKKIERVPGADLFYNICEQAEKNGWSVFLIGGKKNVAHVARSKLLDKYPDLKIVGTIDGVSIDPENGNLYHVTKIRESGANIVAVALGAPKQELWIANNMKRTKANVFIGIGGTLDFVSGNIPRAPLWMRDLSLEWLFRLFVEPRRYKRIFNALITFPILVLFAGKKEYR